MASVLLAIDIILAIGITILVLLQRSEGGALGALGGGGGNSMFTGRQAGNMLTRLTWWFFAMLVVVNLALVIVSKHATVEESISLVADKPTAQSNRVPMPAGEINTGTTGEPIAIPAAPTDAPASAAGV